MRAQRWMSLAAALVLASPALAQTAAPATTTERPPVTPIKASKIILVGDSTTQSLSGWGGAFCANHVTSFLHCVNMARGGRSTYNYRAEGSWDLALSEMNAPGFETVWVLIQFGHNDQPGKPGRSTDLATEFPDNLRRYVREVRAAGAVPVLVTPLTRRQFKEGKLENDLEPWSASIRAVAEEMDVPLVDLNARSFAGCRRWGRRSRTASRSAPLHPTWLPQRYRERRLLRPHPRLRRRRPIPPSNRWVMPNCRSTIRISAPRAPSSSRRW